MRYLQPHAAILGTALLVTLITAFPCQAQQKLPDSTLYTQYSTNIAQTQVAWTTCGYLPLSYGCYGTGVLGTFTYPCAIVQNVPAPLNLNTVLRYIYVLDAGSAQNGAILSVYKRTDTVTQSNDIIVVTMVASVPLPMLIGGNGATCFLAQNPSYIYVSSGQSSYAAAIKKADFSVNYLESAPNLTTSITADSYGYVTIVFGSGGNSENYVYGPNGQEAGGGGGIFFMINPQDGLNPLNFPPANPSHSSTGETTFRRW
jgi:hypothetical protein